MSNRKGMPLADALGIDRGAVVSFVGGGGKTSSMFRLASELSSAGRRVVTTTTTHISEAQVRMAPASLRFEDLHLLQSRLDEFRHCLLVGRPDGKGRVFGAAPELIRSVHERTDVDVILVEADGSRSRPFKAPGLHEPVVPDSTTILVPIAGLNALGTVLDEDHAHRSEIISSITGQTLGTLITAETIAATLPHPEGGAKQLPPGARLIPLLNKSDTEANLLQARDIAERLLAKRNVDRVVISSMIADPPVLECRKPVAAIVLAAGMSTRFGRTKQILKWGNASLVAHAAQTALDAGLDPVIVVLGSDAVNVETALAGLPVMTVFNGEYAAGQSTSIRCGIDALPDRTGAAIFLLADQPLVTPSILKQIIQAHCQTLAPACVPVFGGKRGNPVLFDRVLFEELRGMNGDTGGRQLLAKYHDRITLVLAEKAVLMDIDIPADYEALKKLERRISQNFKQTENDKESDDI